MKKRETDAVFGTATAFFYERNNRFYFITNGHNVTGENSFNQEKIHKYGAVFPDLIETAIWNQVGEDSKAKGPLHISLYEDDDCTQPKWLVHPQFSYAVDVIAIEFEKPKNGNMVLIEPLNEYGFDKFEVQISDEVFVLGYPFGLTNKFQLPIWKRGSIASEPTLEYQGLPCVLIDTATRSGMSGAPVIFQRTGVHGLQGKLTLDTTFGTVCGFVGVYSGRLGDGSEGDAQLGFVWRKEVIDEIIDGRVYGDTDFQRRSS